MKIIFEHDKCIDCGTCSAICPKHWKMGEDGKARLLDSKLNSETGNYEKEIKDADCNQEAADSCPVRCIHIK